MNSQLFAQAIAADYARAVVTSANRSAAAAGSANAKRNQRGDTKTTVGTSTSANSTSRVTGSSQVSVLTSRKLSAVAERE